MKTKPRRRIIPGILLWAGLCPLMSLSCQAAAILIGTGPHASHVVLESPNLGVRHYEVRYDAAGGLYDAKFLIDRIVAEDSAIAMSFVNFGTTTEPNFFLNSVTYNSVTETNESSPPWTPYWAHWVSGGSGYMNADFSFNPGEAPAGEWSTGFGISTPNRQIAPGSWDALFFSDGATVPSVVPIPEPSTWLLALMASLLIVHRRRT